MRDSESVCVRVCVRCVCVWGVGRCCGGSLGRVGIVQNTEIGVGVSFPPPLSPPLTRRPPPPRPQSGRPHPRPSPPAWPAGPPPSAPPVMGVGASGGGGGGETKRGEEGGVKHARPPLFSLLSFFYLAQTNQQVVQVVVRLLLGCRHGGLDAGRDGRFVRGGGGGRRRRRRRGCVFWGEGNGEERSSVSGDHTPALPSLFFFFSHLLLQPHHPPRPHPSPTPPHALPGWRTPRSGLAGRAAACPRRPGRRRPGLPGRRTGLCVSTGWVGGGGAR